MPEQRDPPPTAEGWYALHDFRRIDWDAWREAPERTRERALSEGVEHLETRLAVEDADEGDSALYSVLGHDADLLVVHLRPTTAHLDALQRQFECTALAAFTERTESFVSVTEASGYSERAREYLDGDRDENSGLANYIQTRLEPTIPDATHVCFYPMNKRRRPGQNWYDLSFEERAEHMDAHGDIGRDYGGQVVQMITGAIALDDWEWGVTLWGDDLTEMKDLLSEMRFDPSTSQYAEFGSFHVGRRLPAADLPALLAGDPVPTDDVSGSDPDGPVHATGVERAETDRTADDGGASAEATSDETTEDEAAPAGVSGGGRPNQEVPDDVETVTDDQMPTRLSTLGIREGEDYTAGTHALVVYSTADATDLATEVDGLRGNFEHYDTHVLTSVRASQGRSAVVSVWETERAAGIAEGFLTDLPAVTRSVSGPLGEGEAETDTAADHTIEESPDIREQLDDLDVYAGKPHGEDIYALVLYSEAGTEQLVGAVEELSAGFDRYDTHEGTSVYETHGGGMAAVVSLWATQEAADTASDHLADLPGTVGWADETDGFATMGMFYTVEPESREEFVETFGEIQELLAGMDGHRETALLVDTDRETDMFIASRWDSRDDAMTFFGSDAFAETVDWGRDVLADRPRHVFLA